MKPQQSITSLPPSPDQDRHSRMLKYGIMMGIRVICLIVVFFVPDWWKVIPALGAVFLPYFAVVVANVGSDRAIEAVERPGTVLPYRETPDFGGARGSADDVPGSRDDAGSADETGPSADAGASAPDGSADGPAGSGPAA